MDALLDSGEGAAPDVVSQPAVVETNTADPTTDTQDAKAWIARIERCKSIRKDLVKAWSDNVDFRRGKPFTQSDDTDRVNVNLDWSLSKSKHAQLYSQTPQVYLHPKQKQFTSAVPAFQRQLNDTLEECNVGAAMDEAVLDAINASGIGVVLAGYQALEEATEVPAVTVTPEMQQQADQGLIKIPMMPSKRVVSRRHYTTRISPSDFLWPDEFMGSDFDQADWVGQSGKLLWSEAQRTFKLTEDDKQKVLSTRTKDETLRSSTNREYGEEVVVEFDEIYYWAYRFDEKAKYFKQINHIVFIRGKSEPAYHGPWKGQQFNEQSGAYIGACKFPLRVLTLTYISDDAIPPSDSAIGRPQIEEMIESRSQIVLNRKRSQPWRWADVNRMDPMVLDSMMRGEFQAVHPVQGNGDKAMGEVARAAYPREDFEFDTIIRHDLEQQWQVNPNFEESRQSAKEAGFIQQNFQTRNGYERARVAKFFVGIAEVTGGLLALYGDFPILGQEDIQKIDQAWDRKQFGNDVVYKIRPDATILLDANQRIDRIERFLNLTGKSGFVNPKPLIAELAELHGIDPADVVVDPPKHEPQEPNISYRFSGVEDLTNPIAIALMIKSGQAPSPEELDAAKKLLAAVSMPPEPPVAPQAGPPPDLNGQRPAANPSWGAADKVMKRTEDM